VEVISLPVDPEFFDMLNYSICRAVNEALGKDGAESIFRKVGEINYGILKAKGEIKPSEDPLDTLEQIARYLERVGYMEKIEIKRVSDRELLLKMHGVSVLDSSVKLVDSGMAPSHYMTNLMFAALKEYGVEAELIDLGFDVEKNVVQEKWVLKGR